MGEKMLTKFTDRFIAAKAAFVALDWSYGQSAAAILSRAVEFIQESEDCYGPDPTRVAVAADFGDYQGTVVLIVGEKGYQPSRHWVTTMAYGSCSSCDTLLGIVESPVEERGELYYSVALHMLQRMVEV